LTSAKDEYGSRASSSDRPHGSARNAVAAAGEFGGGKSWALRRILEQTASSVQQLVIDPEGEFSTLRKKFDYVIAAPRDGDALATPATASLLARRLLESGSSAILDIYDLKAHERIAFVRTFLDALVNAPKALWHPVLVALDEAHVYAPQSTRDESSGAVIDIATRDRKRGQCAGDVEGAHPGQGLASVPGREARSPVTARKNTPASASDL
jgi:DNA helicase HerA-like ATPase